MKNFSVLFLNFAVILVFFLVVYQKNKDLNRSFNANKIAINSQVSKQAFHAQFKSKQEQIQVVYDEIAALERENDRSLDALIRFMNGVPHELSLTSLNSVNHKWILTGETHSQNALEEFIRSHKMTLLKREGSFFQIGGSI